MNTTRHDWVDALKFLGIFYIYAGHYGQSAGKVYPFVFLFHVALFFFIAGMFHKSSDGIKLTIYAIYDKFKRIIIPYFIF